jgi:hypothetical protein
MIATVSDDVAWEIFQMAKVKKFAVSVAAALLVSATSASAMITTFAQFVNASGGRNIRWVNNGTSATNGTGGRLYTTASGTGTAPAASNVLFKFEQSPLSLLSFIPSTFFMDITVASGNPATAMGTTLVQPIPMGGFSFLTSVPIMVGSTTFAPGSNLLTATFTMASVDGSGSAGFYGNTSMASMTYTSDFLDFSGTTDRDFSMGLTSITPTLFQSVVGGPKALRTFRAFANGSFSSNPAPMIPSIPEPEVWGMMVVGFGLVGLQIRRRKLPVTVVA